MNFPMEPTLRSLIAERGLRQDWLATKLGVSDATLSKWLSGASSLPVQHVHLFASLLNVGAGEIVASAIRSREQRPRD
jgi:transcriptional regulator with XRE-family HTH domain